jgi:hypothetical protein
MHHNLANGLWFSATGAGDEELPPALGTGSRVAAGPSAPPPSPPTGADINAQPKHVSSRPSWWKSTAPCGCSAPPWRGRPPRAANARVNWAGKPVTASTPTSTSTTRIHPRERARSLSPPQRCCGPCPPPRHPRHGTCTARRRRSSSKRPFSRLRAQRLAFASRGAHRMMGGTRCRALGPRGQLGRAPCQPGAHAGQGAAPRHTRTGVGWRCPQCHQRSADEQSGGAGGGRLTPSAGWTLR